jgi:hypothetical protein
VAEGEDVIDNTVMVVVIVVVIVESGSISTIVRNCCGKAKAAPTSSTAGSTIGFIVNRVPLRRRIREWIAVCYNRWDLHVFIYTS